MVNLQRCIAAKSLAATIELVVASRDCDGIARAHELGLNVELLAPKEFTSNVEFSRALFAQIRSTGAELVVLAGFLSKIVIPEDYSDRVLNIHPSLIPAFCGHGMYGHHVHVAVIARGCKVSGCTVHFCDNEYDHGPIILQQTVPVTHNDTAETLAAKVQAAECEAYPEAIRLLNQQRLRVKNGRVEILNET